MKRVQPESEFSVICQTITFGPDQSSFFSDVIEAVKEAGFDGLECGYKHIRKISPQRLKEWLVAADLSLAAIHIGRNLIHPQARDAERGLIHEILAYASVLGTRVIMYSGLCKKSPDKIRLEIEMLSKAARVCRDQGFQLLFHNHDWEFSIEGLELSELVQASAGAIKFCPDVGWLHRAGRLDFLGRVREHVGAIHLKDFDAANEFVELGRGVVPLSEAVQWVREHFDSLLITAEQDRSKKSPRDAIRNNANFVRRELTENRSADLSIFG